MVKRSSSVFDSSSSDDDSLFDAPFEKSDGKELSSSKHQKKKRPRKSAVPTTKQRDSEASSSSVARHPQLDDDEQDEERMNQVALRKASTAILPSGITGSSQLVWYHDPDSMLVYPCRICEPAEALHLRLDPDSWDRSEVALVQALDFRGDEPFPGRNDRLLVNKTDLHPYHGGEDANRWCKKTCKLYQEQCLAHAKSKYRSLTKTDLLAESMFLDRILQSALEKDHDDEHVSSSSSTSSIASDDLEVPYSENLLPDDDFFDPNLFSDKQTEPLRVGDVIEYTHPLFVKGDSRGRRVATVLSTNPTRHPMLVLDNGEVLPETTRVKRIKVMEHGVLYKHPHGFFRPIEGFKILPEGQARVLDGVRAESRRVHAIVNQNMEKLAEKARADGFCPMDLPTKTKSKRAAATVNAKSVAAKKKSKDTAAAANRKPAAAKTVELSDSDDSSSDDESMSGRRVTDPRKRPAVGKAKNDGDVSSDSSVSQSDLRKLSMDKPKTDGRVHHCDCDSDADKEAVRKRPAVEKKKSVDGNVSSDSSVSQSDLRKLSMATRPKKKDGGRVHRGDCDSDSDEDLAIPTFGGSATKKQRQNASGGSARKRPIEETHSGGNQQRKKQRTDADIDSDPCLDASSRALIQLAARKKPAAAASAPRAQSGEQSKAQPLKLTRAKRPAKRKKTVSRSAVSRKEKVATPKKATSSSKPPSSGRTHNRRTTARKSSNGAAKEAWDESDEDEPRSSSARDTSRSSNDSLMQESPVQKRPSGRSKVGTLSHAKGSEQQHKEVNLVCSSRKEKSDASKEKAKSDPFHFPSSDEESLVDQRSNRRESSEKKRTKAHRFSPSKSDRDQVDKLVSSLFQRSSRRGTPKTSRKRASIASCDESTDDEVEENPRSSVVSDEKSPAIDLTGTDSEASPGNGANRRPLNGRKDHSPTADDFWTDDFWAQSEPSNAGWMKKMTNKPAAAQKVETKSNVLGLTKHIRKPRHSAAKMAPLPKESSQSSESPDSVAIGTGKSDDPFASSQDLSPAKSTPNPGSRASTKSSYKNGDDLIDSDSDEEKDNSQGSQRKRLFHSGERKEQAEPFPFAESTPLVKRHRDSARKKTYGRRFVSRYSKNS